MKTQSKLFLGMVCLCLFPALVLAANSITNITFSPPSPTALLNGDDINITFDYTTDIKAGVLIFARPYSGRFPSPNYAASGGDPSPSPFGHGAQSFTITSGRVTVTRVHFTMVSNDQSTTYLDFFVNVNFSFGTSINNIQLNPASPASLPFGSNVTIGFDYAISEAGPHYIFARPMTNDSLTPNYGAHGSPTYVGPVKGSESGAFFEIISGNAVVDQIRFQIMDTSFNVIYEKFVNVRYRYPATPCVWYVDDSAVGTPQTGGSWYYAFRNLQDALAVAQSGDEIWVAQGTYRPDRTLVNPSGTGDSSASFALETGVGVYGGFVGNETDRVNRNWRVNKTILSGDLLANDGPNFANNSDNSLHVVTGNGADLTAILDGFTITAGNANGAYPNYLGGGLYISNGSATIRNCLFRENMAGSGGALADWSLGSSLISECMFLNNQAPGATGGAVSLQHSNPSLINCQFLNNSASSGGGIYTIGNDNSPSISNCVFSGNHATGNGGAMYNTGVGGFPNPAPPKLQNNTFYSNTALSNGGALFNNNTNGNAVIDSCIFWNNSDASGALETDQIVYSGALTINYSCLQNWTGALGGTGNIGQNPLFINPNGLDGVSGTEDDNLHLLVGSPCINTGNPSPALNDPDGSRNDMGAYGGPWADQNSGGGLSGSGFIFTQLGNIPTAAITQNSLDPTKLLGHANVDPSIATALSIPAYTNTPFGSKVWVYGLFGHDDPVDYYQVLIGPWVGDTPPAPADFTPLTETLVKVQYIYNNVTHEWTYSYVTVGPQTVWGVENVYQLTTPSVGSGFWSNMDLRMIWDTGKFANGKYTLKIRGFHDLGLFFGLSDVTPTNSQELIVAINNSPVKAEILKVKYDPSNPAYIGITDGEIPECGIIKLNSLQENLRFNITASHPDGYLLQYILDDLWGKNNYGGVIATDSYNPGVDGTNWYGVTNLLVESKNAPSPLPNWQQCAYQFRLRAWANVTNGYYYIYSDEFNDHYYIDLTGSMSGCSTADLNKDGRVDSLDLAIMASHWLQTCL
jgi:hypothetical protein